MQNQTTKSFKTLFMAGVVAIALAVSVVAPSSAQASSTKVPKNFTELDFSGMRRVGISQDGVVIVSVRYEAFIYDSKTGLVLTNNGLFVLDSEEHKKIRVFGI